MSCPKLCVNAQMSEKHENHRIVTCSVRTRPIRSARKPASQPPTADDSSVAVTARPALPASTCHSAITVPMTSG